MSNRLATPPVSIMKAVIYCRVSTKEQTKNLSLPTQLKACRDYCRRYGYVVAREFVECESAKTANRTELKALLTYCKQNEGAIQALVVYNVTRFARERYDHVILRALLLKLADSPLTGLARCGECGGTLTVRSRQHGRQRVYFYACSSFHHRGRHQTAVVAAGAR